MNIVETVAGFVNSPLNFISHGCCCCLNFRAG